MHLKLRAAVLGSSLVVLVGTAVPAEAYSSSVGPAAGPVVAKASPRAADKLCSTAVVGYSADGRSRGIDVTDGAVTGTFRHPRQDLAIGPPTGLAYQGTDKTRKGRFSTYLLAMRNGNVRVAESKYVVATRRFTWVDSYRLVEGPYRPRVLAGSFGWGPHVYFGNGKSLHRYDWFSKPNSTEFLRGGGKVSGADLVSLVNMGRDDVAGVPTDLLFGTTRQGQLVQVRVPRNKPDRASTHVIAESGFKGVDELSPGTCKGQARDFGFVTIDRDAELGAQAKYWELTDWRTPHQRDLFGGDFVTGKANWDLDAVL